MLPAVTGIGAVPGNGNRTSVGYRVTPNLTKNGYSRDESNWSKFEQDVFLWEGGIVQRQRAKMAPSHGDIGASSGRVWGHVRIGNDSPRWTFTEFSRT